MAFLLPSWLLFELLNFVVCLLLGLLHFGFGFGFGIQTSVEIVNFTLESSLVAFQLRSGCFLLSESLLEVLILAIQQTFRVFEGFFGFQILFERLFGFFQFRFQLGLG